MPKQFDLRAVAETALRFRDARLWRQFHTPANLAKGIVIEATELLEHFLWTRNPDEEHERAADRKTEIEEELADIAVFLIYLAHDLGVDLAAAVERKIALNEKKYPLEKSKGSAKKYTDL